MEERKLDGYNPGLPLRAVLCDFEIQGFALSGRCIFAAVRFGIYSNLLMLTAANCYLRGGKA